MSKKYNHMFTIAFEVVSKHENSDKIPHKEILAGLMRRIANVITAEGISEAVGPSDDVFEIDEEDNDG